MKQFTFTSSAIDDLSMEGDQVSVTFHGGREYTYKAVDPITFETALNGEIADPEGSVGRLVNQLIRSEDLVTVWQVAQGVLCYGKIPDILNKSTNKIMKTTTRMKEFFTETEWDLIYNFIGNALEDDYYDPEEVYSIRAKIHNLFLWSSSIINKWKSSQCSTLLKKSTTQL